MFEDIVGAVLVNPTKVYPAIAGKLDLIKIRQAWDRTSTFEEFILDPYVNLHWRTYRTVNLGLTDKAAETSFAEWVNRIYPERPRHRDETLSAADYLNF